MFQRRKSWCRAIDIQAHVCTVDCCTFFIDYCCIHPFYHALDQRISRPVSFEAILCISLFRSFFTLNDSISVLLLLLLPLMMMSAQCMLHVICLLAVGVLQLHFTFKLVGTISISKLQLPVLFSLEMRIPISFHGK